MIPGALTSEETDRLIGETIAATYGPVSDPPTHIALPDGPVLPVREMPDDALEILASELKRRRRGRKPARLSMSTLRRADACMLSHYLTRTTGDTAGPEAVAGRAFHEIAAAIAFRAYMRGETVVSLSAALRIADHVLSRLDEPLRALGRQEVLEWVRTWSDTATFAHQGVDYFGIEELWTHELDMHVLSARLDRVEHVGETVEIEDYKTGQPPHNPAYIYSAFQPRNYAWHAAKRFPDAWTFSITERFIRTGRPYTVVYTRADVEEEIEPWLSAIVGRVARAWASARFDPNPGSWCHRCPAQERCTLPQDVRPVKRTDYATRAAVLKVREARVKRERQELKDAVDVLGLEGLDVGDERLAFHPTTKRQVMGKREADKAGVREDLDAALDALDEFKVKVTRPEFKWAKIPEAE